MGDGCGWHSFPFVKAILCSFCANSREGGNGQSQSFLKLGLGRREHYPPPLPPT